MGMVISFNEDGTFDVGEGMGKEGGMGNGSGYKMILSLGRGAKEKIGESETQRFA